MVAVAAGIYVSYLYMYDVETKLIKKIKGYLFHRGMSSSHHFDSYKLLSSGSVWNTDVQLTIPSKSRCMTANIVITERQRNEYLISGFR